jgi:hypothetical protein
LLQHCISEVRSNPSKFNAATLGSRVDAYCRFLEKRDHWGGYIEMDELLRFYKVEICVLHIEECSNPPVNSCQVTKRIFLLYDGIRCDRVIFRGFMADGVRQAAVDDTRVWEFAMQMTRVMQASGGSKSDRTAMMKSEV